MKESIQIKENIKLKDVIIKEVYKWGEVYMKGSI